MRVQPVSIGVLEPNLVDQGNEVVLVPGKERPIHLLFSSVIMRSQNSYSNEDATILASLKKARLIHRGKLSRNEPSISNQLIVACLSVSGETSIFSEPCVHA